MTNFHKILAVILISFSALTILSAQTTVGTITAASANCDLTISSCDGDIITLTPQNQSSYQNYKWYFGTVSAATEITAANAAANNVVATGFATNFPTIKVVSGGGTYILTAEFATPSGCATKNDVFILNFTPLPTAANATLTLCETVAAGTTADFTLSAADATVTGGASGVAVTYYGSLSDAQNKMTPLSNAYTSGTKTLYARVENTTTGCYKTATLTLTVTPKVTPTFTAVSPICSGATLSALPTTSNNSITGTWSPALNNTTTTVYTFTPTSGQCATTTTLTITVNQLPDFTLVKPTACPGTSEDVNITGLTNAIAATAQLKIDAGAYGAYPSPAIVTSLAVGSHALTVRNAEGCETIKNITISPITAAICIPVTVTRN